MKNQAVLAAGLMASGTAAGRNLLPLPPMGFNNWARFMTNINESIFVDAAEAMASNGLLAAGYNRLHLDDAWSTKNRTANGSMEWDAKKFPHGLPWLTKYMKSKGFIPGIYTDAGTLSCGGYPGALDHEQQDLDTFLDWGFEYLKMDGCNLPDSSDDEAEYHTVYGKWHEVLEASERPMIFSDSAPAYFSGTKNNTDWYKVMGWVAQYGQLARHSADIVTYPGGPAWDSIMYNYGEEVLLARYQQQGYINDPDFLITDNPTLSLDEKKSHFALWSSFSAPLLLSVNTPSLSKEEIAILTNKDLIAVNQDKLIQQATLVSQDGTWDVLTKSLSNGDRLLTVLNRGNDTADLKVSLERIGLSSKALRRTDSLSVKDLWTGKTTKVKVSDGGITASKVPSHGTAVFRIAKSASPVTPTGMIFNTQSLKCLTDDKSGKVTWAKCAASDAQVWNVRSDGHINSLLRPDECIVDAKGKILSRHSGCHTDAWTHHISGNLINGVSKKCLTEEADGSATTMACESFGIDQVFGLPVGVAIDQS